MITVITAHEELIRYTKQELVLHATPPVNLVTAL
jgi:hypothetical protein